MGVVPRTSHTPIVALIRAGRLDDARLSIEHAMSMAGGCVARAARALGICREHWYRYCRAVGLDPVPMAARARSAAAEQKAETAAAMRAAKARNG